MTGNLLYAESSFVYGLKAEGEFKLELQSGNALFGGKLAIFCLVWPWNLMDVFEKREGNYFILRQALCIIFKPSMNSQISYIRRAIAQES